MTSCEAHGYTNFSLSYRCSYLINDSFFYYKCPSPTRRGARGGRQHGAIPRNGQDPPLSFSQ